MRVQQIGWFGESGDFMSLFFVGNQKRPFSRIFSLLLLLIYGDV